MQGKVAANFVDSGEQSLKNIALRCASNRVELGGEGVTPPTCSWCRRLTPPSLTLALILTSVWHGGF